MIGIAIPNVPTLAATPFSLQGSIASQTFTKQDAGASIIAFDGTPINEQAIVPGTPFFDYLYSNPNKTIGLTLRRADGSTQSVELPPQPSKSLGVRFTIGPIVAMVENGPAAKAGMQIGDIIQSYGDTTDRPTEREITISIFRHQTRNTITRWPHLAPSGATVLW